MAEENASLLAELNARPTLQENRCGRPHATDACSPRSSA